MAVLAAFAKREAREYCRPADGPADGSPWRSAIAGGSTEHRDPEQHDKESDDEHQRPHVAWLSRLHRVSPRDCRTGPGRSARWSVAAIPPARTSIFRDFGRSFESGGGLPREEEQQRPETPEERRQPAGADQVSGFRFHAASP